MIRSLRVVLVGAVLLMLGCPSSSSQQHDLPSAVAAPTATSDDVSFPVVSNATQEEQDAAAEFEKLSDRHDEACVHLPMDPSVGPRRPGGIGCPRPEGSPENWGAQ